MTRDLISKVEGATARVTLNRESRRNALSQEMIAGLMGILESMENDNAVRTVCLTGAGEKAFCSGADLASAFGGAGGDSMAGAKQYGKLLKQMARFPKPLVARVNGPCLAGGLGLMLSCDMVIARSDAFFCTPEVNVGIFPMMVGALLYRNVGRKKAVDMVLTARKVTAPEAETIGLITRAVDPGRLDAEIDATLAGLNAKSPVGIKIGKEAFRTMSDMPFEEAVDALCEALARAVSTEDAAEGMRAFVEKRAPVFKGK